jgi:hypothetical protein
MDRDISQIQHTPLPRSLQVLKTSDPILAEYLQAVATDLEIEMSKSSRKITEGESHAKRGEYVSEMGKGKSRIIFVPRT